MKWKRVGIIRTYKQYEINILRAYPKTVSLQNSSERRFQESYYKRMRFRRTGTETQSFSWIWALARVRQQLLSVQSPGCLCLSKAWSQYLFRGTNYNNIMSIIIIVRWKRQSVSSLLNTRIKQILCVSFNQWFVDLSSRCTISVQQQENIHSRFQAN